MYTPPAKVVDDRSFIDKMLGTTPKPTGPVRRPEVQEALSIYGKKN